MPQTTLLKIITTGFRQLAIAAIVPLATLSLNPERAAAFGFTTVYKIRRENPCALCLGMRGESMTK